MSRRPTRAQAWETGFAHAQDYAEQHGNLRVPVAYVDPDGYPTGRWVADQRARRTGYRARFAGDRLTDDQVERLERLGMAWETHPRRPRLLAAERPDLAAQYDGDLNRVPLGAVRLRSKQDVAWRCPRGHAWSEPPVARAARTTAWCPTCRTGQTPAPRAAR